LTNGCFLGFFAGANSCWSVAPKRPLSQPPQTPSHAPRPPVRVLTLLVCAGGDCPYCQSHTAWHPAEVTTGKASPEDHHRHKWCPAHQVPSPADGVPQPEQDIHAPPSPKAGGGWSTQTSRAGGSTANARECTFHGDLGVFQLQVSTQQLSSGHRISDTGVRLNKFALRLIAENPAEFITSANCKDRKVPQHNTKYLIL